MRINFTAPWPCPDGTLALASFSVEVDPSGNWLLYKKTHWGEGWYEVSPALAVDVQRRRGESFRHPS